jgi:methylmalonyl-CoA mutase
LQKAAIHNGNVFAALMEAAKTASLGEMSDALFEVGGKYRRNM